MHDRFEQTHRSFTNQSKVLVFQSVTAQHNPVSQNQPHLLWLHSSTDVILCLLNGLCLSILHLFFMCIVLYNCLVSTSKQGFREQLNGNPQRQEDQIRYSGFGGKMEKAFDWTVQLSLTLWPQLHLPASCFLMLLPSSSLWLLCPPPQPNHLSLIQTVVGSPSLQIWRRHV